MDFVNITYGNKNGLSKKVVITLEIQYSEVLVSVEFNMQWINQQLFLLWLLNKL